VQIGTGSAMVSLCIEVASQAPRYIACPCVRPHGDGRGWTPLLIDPHEAVPEATDPDRRDWSGRFRLYCIEEFLDPLC
jgi:hypothetical protein